MAEVFSYAIEARPSGRVAFDVLTADFGDGYTQSAANGINNRSKDWDIKATGSLDGSEGMDVGGIKAFLDARQGWQAFEWETPDGSTDLFRCLNYSLAHLSANIYTLTATFMDARQ